MNAARLSLCLLMAVLLTAPAFAYTLSGDIDGAEWLGGITYVYAFSLDIQNPGFYIGLALLGNGAYFILGVPEGSYILTAFQDRDGNLIPSIDDYLGYYGGAIPQTVEVTGNVNNLDITVEPLPFTIISGLVSCPGEQFGLTYILAASDPLFEDVVTTGILLDITGNAQYTLFVDPGQYYIMAYLDADFSFSRTAEDPQIFYGAPDYPILVDVTGGSAENIDLPLLLPPDVNLTLTPQGTPIVIPAGGGSFNYTVSLANTGTEPASGQVWFDVTLPDGSPYGPVLGPASFDLPAGFSGIRDRSQAVPGAAPAGTYSYNSYFGVYPAIVWTDQSFTFEKAGASNAPGNGSWTAWGDDFDNWLENSSSATESMPQGIAIANVYPNPFNPTTVLSFELSTASHVNLQVYDTAGQLVATLVNGWRAAGTHEMTFEASSLPSGVYFARLTAGEYTGVQKLVLMK